MGQIFLSKYNFVFNSDKKQIGFYKKVNREAQNDENHNKKNKISNELLIIIIAIGVALVFSIIGIAIGKKIFCCSRKILANELTDEIDYEYKTKDDNNFKPDDNIEIEYNPPDEKKVNSGIKEESIN